MNLDEHVTQAEFAELVGTSQPTISRMVSDGALTKRGTAREWIQAYIAALVAENEALAGAADDSAEARASRLALIRATTRLREQQTRMAMRRYRGEMDTYIENAMGEIRAALFQALPSSVVSRLLPIIPRDEARYAAAAAFRDIVDETVQLIIGRIDEPHFADDQEMSELEDESRTETKRRRTNKRSAHA